MASTINADNGVSSGSAGLKSTADSSGVLSLQTNGTTAVTVDTSQNVGVGITAPNYKLSVNGVGNFYSGVSGLGRIWLGDPADPSGYIGIYRSTLGPSNGTTAGNGLNFASIDGYTFSTGLVYTAQTERMRITSTGSVGIGTNSPGAILDINGSVILGNAATGGLAIRGGAGGEGGQIDLYNPDNASTGMTIDVASADSGRIFGIRNNFSLQLGQLAGTGGTVAFFTAANERMRINSSGYLLVGTTSASGNARLVVNNGNNVSGDFGFVTLLGSNCNNTSSYHYIAVTGGADKFYVYGNGSAANATGSYGTISDIKLKENIVDATPKLADVMRLQVRNFNLKTEPTHKQIGFVAQEFEQVFPGMVDESPDRDAKGNTLETTTKHIKTSVLVPILVKAIQELKAEVDSLKSQLAAKG